MSFIDDLQPGDVLAFSGRSCLSRGIQVCTLGAISHVGILARHPKFGLRLYESMLPHGVHQRNIKTRIDSTIQAGGRVWRYPLTDPLTEDEIHLDLFGRCEEQLEKPYDRVGAIRARALGSWIRWLRLYQGLPNRDDGTSWFCSEFVADKLDYLDRFRTRNPSKWSPVSLCWALVNRGVSPGPDEYTGGDDE